MLQIRTSSILVLLLISISVSCLNAQVNKSELTEIVRAVLEIPKLQQYFHEEIPSRTPLIIESNELLNSQKINTITKFGETIMFMPLSKIQSNGIDNYLITEVLRFKSNIGEIQFYYPIEGLTVYCELQNANDNWEISEYNLWEK